MDRRQKKTRAAILSAFSGLLEQKSYEKITVQEIIDKADVGRTTFYAHFKTKDDLLKELCEELFGHVLCSAADRAHTHGLYSNDAAPDSVFCHLLQHLQKNGGNVLGLLTCESSELFLRYFREGLNALIRSQLMAAHGPLRPDVPAEFLINHVSGSFVEMTLWWIKGRMKQTPEELDRWFRAVIDPIL